MTQPTPDELNAENALICEKLLGWKKRTPSAWHGVEWHDDPYGSDGAQWHTRPTPAFTTWAEAGLILEALQKAEILPAVGARIDGQWSCYIQSASIDTVKLHAVTGPLAVRAAALYFIRSQS